MLLQRKVRKGEVNFEQRVEIGVWGKVTVMVTGKELMVVA